MFNFFLCLSPWFTDDCFHKVSPLRRGNEHEIFRTVDPFHSYSGCNNPFHSYSGCNTAQNGGTEYKVVQKHLIDI